MLSPITTFKERFGEVRFVLAPLAGITDTVFRSLMREMGAQVVISELLSAEGLVRGGKRTRDMLAYDPSERPVGIQIFGSSIATMVEAAKIVQSEGADFVDINFGCPVKKVVCDGGGAAWLKEPEKMGELLSEIKNALRIPLTIKIRTGWEDSLRNADEVIKYAALAGVSWVAIHGRTRAQAYTGLADWEYIRQLSIHSPIPIIGNGDILTAEQAHKRINDGYSHAVMIGRGALKNPWIFKEILEGKGERDFAELINRHFDIAISKKDKVRAFLSLKKFMSWYASGLPYCSPFRASIFNTENVDDLRKIALTFFASAAQYERKDDGQPFLMGGHG